MEHRILAIVVVYKPDLGLLKRNIDAFISYIDCVILWNNSPDCFNEKLLQCESDKIQYHTEGRNIGISKALNYAWRYAQKNKYDYLLTMDQDSVFLNFKVYSDTTIKYNEQEICLIGPGISIGESRTLVPNISEVDDQNHLITSGMLVPISLLNKIGGYCEDFKIEAVDLDLCIRARAAGYRICRNTFGELSQTFGNPYTRKLFGKTYIGANYSSQRLYGIFRNHMILYRRYKCPLAKRLLKVYFINFVPRIFLWEDFKGDKLKAIFRGLKDGFLYKDDN